MNSNGKISKKDRERLEEIYNKIMEPPRTLESMLEIEGILKKVLAIDRLKIKVVDIKFVDSIYADRRFFVYEITVNDHWVIRASNIEWRYIMKDLLTFHLNLDI